MILPGWNDLETAKSFHSFFNITALVMFGFLVLFEILEHTTKETERKSKFSKLTILSLAIAIVAEVIAFPYSNRVEYLFGQEIQQMKANNAEVSAKLAAIKPAKQRLIEFLNNLS